MKRICAFLFFFSVSVSLFPQYCFNKKYCSKEKMGEDFDYRGQSVHGKVLPGDTIKVKAILYRNKTVRIAVCAEESLGNVSYRLYNSLREYSRIADRIEKVTVKKPTYKVDKRGARVPFYDDWGDIVYDEYGDIVYEVESYTEVVTTDTIWRTTRNLSEILIYDSEKNGVGESFYQEEVAQTKSVTIEVIVPPVTSAHRSVHPGCLSILVGSKILK